MESRARIGKCRDRVPAVEWSLLKRARLVRGTKHILIWQAVTSGRIEALAREEHRSNGLETGVLCRHGGAPSQEPSWKLECVCAERVLKKGVAE
jgi:hypothetical protein